jgi:hypothetical protein
MAIFSNSSVWNRRARSGGYLLVALAVLAIYQLVAMNRGCERLPDAPLLYPRWTQTRPTLDGQIQADEWAGAATFSARREQFDHLGNKVGEHSAAIYLKNDEKNLYVATVWKNCLYHGDWKGTLDTNNTDAFLLCVDDDRKIVIADHGQSLYEDEHIPTDLVKDERRDAQQDGFAVLTHSNPRGRGTYQAEFLVPLDTGDENDGVWQPGDTLRLNVLYYEHYNPDRSHTRRAGLFGRSDWRPKKKTKEGEEVVEWSESEWAQVRLATE